MVLAAVVFASIAAVVSASGQCDASTNGASCIDAAAPLQVTAEGKDDAIQEAAEGLVQEGIEQTVERTPLSGARLGVVVVMFGSMIAWVLTIFKFAIDGSLPARLALWGLLPEVCAAISVRSLVALLRLKTHPTPTIVLRQCVDDAGAKLLAKAMREYGKTSCLEAIELPYNPDLGEEGLREIVSAALDKDSQVMELDLSYNPQLGDAAITALRPLFEDKASKLQVLRLAACSISPKGLEVLSASAARLKLRLLDLGRNEFSGHGEALAGLCDAPLLDELALPCCGLKASDVRALAEQLPYTSIRSLQLSGNGFGSPGLEALAEHLPSCAVDELGLEYNNIEYEALSVLGTAWVKRPFARVSLKGNKMSHEQITMFIKTLKSMHAP